MYNPDGDRAVQQGIVVEVEEAYTHCPRAANYSRIWDEEEIRRRKQSGQHPLRGAADPPPLLRGDSVKGCVRLCVPARDLPGCHSRAQ